MELLQKWENFSGTEEGRRELLRDAEAQLVAEWAGRGRGYLLGWEIERARKAGMLSIERFSEEHLQAEGCYVARLGSVSSPKASLDLRTGVTFRRGACLFASSMETFAMSPHLRMEFAGLSEFLQVAFVQTPQGPVVPPGQGQPLTIPLVNAVSGDVELEAGLELALVRFYFDAEVPHS
jgi:hypothetical protein